MEEASTPFQYYDQPITTELVNTISDILDDAGIKSVLWGELLMKAHGIPFGVNNIEFCIPDGHMTKAYEVLKQRGFLSCSEGQACQFAADRTYEREYPPPARHLHLRRGRKAIPEIEGKPIRLLNCSAVIHPPPGLLLHNKSDTLFAVSSFVPSSIKEDPAAKIILASDPDGLASPLLATSEECDGGESSSKKSPVRVPSAHCLMEAYALLIKRSDDFGFRVFWLAMMTEMFSRVPPGCLNDEYMDEHCREFYLSAVVDGKYPEAVRILKESP